MNGLMRPYLNCSSIQKRVGKTDVLICISLFYFIKNVLYKVKIAYTRADRRCADANKKYRSDWMFHRIEKQRSNGQIDDRDV